MKNMKEKIIDYIRKNRVSTTEIADCLGKSGAVSNVLPINSGHFKVGNIFWTYAYDESNWNLHKEIIGANEDDIVFVELFNCNNRAVLGELVAKYLILYKQVAAIIVDGNVRDAPKLIKENYPIWCKGVTPIGCFNIENRNTLEKELISYRIQKYNGAIAVCDDCGVVIIQKEFHNEDFYKKLEFIEEQEDIWFDCIDRKKWNTFDTVCLKKYLE